MRKGKKLLLFVSLLATGTSIALFFRKDATQNETRHEAAADFAFRERVERRVANDSAWAKAQGTRRVTPPQPIARVPASASIPEPATSASEHAPTFSRSNNPVGALLEPVVALVSDDPPSLTTGELQTPPTGEITMHRVVDGDTLSSLALRYLGKSDRYLELFELNRDVLASPDLLPIGVLLKIPGAASPTLENPTNDGCLDPTLQVVAPRK